MAIQGKEILKHRDNVAPEPGDGKWQEKFAPLRNSFRDSSRVFPAKTSAGAMAPAYVVLVVTFQRLYNQNKHATGNLRCIFQALFGGACCGRYRALASVAS